MIALVGNRPALDVAGHQIQDYDTAWLEDALRRAAQSADHGDFPFLAEIHHGVVDYLETKCSLELLPLPQLFDRIRGMLERIGCPIIAEHLQPLAPPVTFSLEEAARSAGNGFELAFFETLRHDLANLRHAGAEEIHFTGLHDAILQLRKAEKWDRHCDHLLNEVRDFLHARDRDVRNRRRDRPFNRPERDT